MRSSQRLVIDRVKNYLQKYLPMAQEITEQEVEGAEPGSAKFAKLYQKLIAERLDARPKKVVVEEATTATAAWPQPPFRGFWPLANQLARTAGTFGGSTAGPVLVNRSFSTRKCLSSSSHESRALP